MQGYDREEALKYMLTKADKSAYGALGGQLESLIRQAIATDFDYMRASGVIAEDGMMGEVFYDDDDAFEFMLDAMSRQRGYSEEQEAMLAALIDDYMEWQSAFLGEKGLISWDD